MFRRDSGIRFERTDKAAETAAGQTQLRRQRCADESVGTGDDDHELTGPGGATEGSPVGVRVECGGHAAIHLPGKISGPRVRVPSQLLLLDSSAVRSSEASEAAGGRLLLFLQWQPGTPLRLLSR